jgi:twitching motility protein PilT
MVSILDTINQERGEHILTIEDPIEFVFTDKKSIFSQREI